MNIFCELDRYMISLYRINYLPRQLMILAKIED